MPVQAENTLRLPNPFTYEYVREQIEFYDLESYDKDGIKLVAKKPWGRNDDYLNKWFEVEDLEVPTFFIDGTLWMSLTRMEIQSQVVPIALAEGKVVLLGLGMGFACLKVMEADRVEEVLVYEKEPRVIAFFKESFSGRPGFHKVKFIEGDAREKFKGESCDFCYADIYSNVLGDHIETDPELFQSRNSIGTYVYWGFERVIWEAMEQSLVQLERVPLLLRWFFSTWMKTPIHEDKDDSTLVNLRFDYEFEEDFLLEAMQGIKLEGLIYSEG